MQWRTRHASQLSSPWNNSGPLANNQNKASITISLWDQKQASRSLQCFYILGQVQIFPWTLSIQNYSSNILITKYCLIRHVNSPHQIVFWEEGEPVISRAKKTMWKNESYWISGTRKQSVQFFLFQGTIDPAVNRWLSPRRRGRHHKTASTFITFITKLDAS